MIQLGNTEMHFKWNPPESRENAPEAFGVFLASTLSDAQAQCEVRFEAPYEDQCEVRCEAQYEAPYGR